MRLVKVTNERCLTVTCFGCHVRVNLADTYADLDGPTYQAYYCPNCVIPPWVELLAAAWREIGEVIGFITQHINHCGTRRCAQCAMYRKVLQK